MAVPTYQIVLAIIECIGFGLNLLTLVLLNRLGLKQTDMWLGVAMAVCDMILSGYKVFELIMLISLGKESFLTHESYVIPMSGFLLFILLNSIACVGYLGLIRWLAICHKFQIKQLKIWWGIYLIHMFFISLLIILCSLNHGFFSSKDSPYAYPKFDSDNPYVLLIRLMIAITLFGCFLIVNIGYLSIAKNYINILDSQFQYNTKAEKQTLRKEKVKVIVKISLMLILYNVIILPFFIVDLMELINQQRRSLFSSKLTSHLIICIAFINPTILVTMHCETWREFKKLWQYISNRYRFSIASSPESSIKLTECQMNDTAETTT